MPRLLRVFGLGAVLVAGGIGAAAAADVPPLPPPLPPPFPMPVVQVFSWTGFYIGGNAGWGWTNGSGTFTTALGADPFTVSNNGFLGGAQLGYNWQTGPFVLGAEADFQGTAASGSLNASAGPTISATAKTPWFGTVRGRVGYAMDRILLYATAGAVYGDSSWSGTEFYGRQLLQLDDLLELDGRCRGRDGLLGLLEREARISVRRHAVDDAGGSDRHRSQRQCQYEHRSRRPQLSFLD